MALQMPEALLPLFHEVRLAGRRRQLQRLAHGGDSVVEAAGLGVRGGEGLEGPGQLLRRRLARRPGQQHRQGAAPLPGRRGGG